MTMTSIFRVDKFKVPDHAREEFLLRVAETHALLRKQPGLVRDAVLEQIAGPGTFNIVTIAEWESDAAIDAAKQTLQAEHARRGFDPRHTMQRLGVEADIANYRAVSVGEVNMEDQLR